jgi:hypothetical protein
MFADILYHLKNPLMVLEEIGYRCRDAVVVETEASGFVRFPVIDLSRFLMQNLTYQ